MHHSVRQKRPVLVQCIYDLSMLCSTHTYGVYNVASKATTVMTRKQQEMRSGCDHAGVRIGGRKSHIIHDA